MKRIERELEQEYIFWIPFWKRKRLRNIKGTVYFEKIMHGKRLKSRLCRSTIPNYRTNQVVRKLNNPNKKKNMEA